MHTHILIPHTHIHSHTHTHTHTHTFTHVHTYTHIHTIDIKKVDKQLMHPMHVKDRYVNVTFIDKLKSDFK